MNVFINKNHHMSSPEERLLGQPQDQRQCLQHLSKADNYFDNYFIHLKNYQRSMGGSTFLKIEGNRTFFAFMLAVNMNGMSIKGLKYLFFESLSIFMKDLTD